MPDPINSSSPPDLRAATADDALDLARVHVASWRETYAGLMPDSVLASLSVTERAARWQAMLSQPQLSDRPTVVQAEQDGQVIGFASCGEQRTQALREQGFTAEISAIYVLQSAQGRGVGSALMAEMARTLAGRGHEAVSLWVLRENAPARRFYERPGGEVVGQQEEQSEDMTLVELAYGWRNLHRLLTSSVQKP